MGEVQTAVRDIIGDAGDPTVLEYLVSCLELEDETAKDAAQMYSNYGDMLVRSDTPPRSWLGARPSDDQHAWRMQHILAAHRRLTPAQRLSAQARPLRATLSLRHASVRVAVLPSAAACTGVRKVQPAQCLSRCHFSGGRGVRAEPASRPRRLQAAGGPPAQPRCRRAEWHSSQEGRLPCSQRCTPPCHGDWMLVPASLDVLGACE